LDPNKPPALLLRDDDEPGVLRILARFVSKEAATVYQVVLDRQIEEEVEPLPQAVEGGDGSPD